MSSTPSEFSLAGKHVNVAMMTSGGLAPCLSSSVAMLVKEWVAAFRANKISGLTFRMYKAGYKGILIGDSFVLAEEHWDQVDCLNYLGGSPIGNSRVKVSYDYDTEKYPNPLINVVFVRQARPLLTLFTSLFLCLAHQH
jgi:6-phosphofructokinase